MSDYQQKLLQESKRGKKLADISEKALKPATTGLTVFQLVFVIITAVFVVPFLYRVLWKLIGSHVHFTNSVVQIVLRIILAGVLLYGYTQLATKLYLFMVKLIEKKEQLTRQKLKEAKREFIIKERSVSKGMKAEEAMWNKLQYFKKLFEPYDDSIIIKKNIILKNHKTGKEFDLDFIMYSKKRKYVIFFECKSYSDCIIYEDGTAEILYRGKPSRNYSTNPAFQLLNTARSFVRQYPEFLNYKKYLVVALPLCYYCTEDKIRNKKTSNVNVYYYYPSVEKQFLDKLKQLYM